MSSLMESEAHYQTVLRAQPQQPEIWCLLGEVRLRLGKWTEAAAAYQNALRLAPALAAGHFGLANVHKEQGQRAEAIACYRRGLAAAPDHAEALLNLGVLLAEESQLDAAIEQWQHLLRLQPDQAQAQQNLGVALAQQGNYAEAMRSLERALELRPDYAEACCNLANVLCQGSRSTGQGPGARGQGEEGRERAVELLLRAARLKPEYVDAYHNLASVLTELHRWADATVWARQAIRLCQAMRQETEVRSRRPEVSGQHQAPLSTHHAPPTTHHPLAASCYNQLGLALAGQARYAEAEAAYQAALEAKPAYAEAHSNLGNLFQEQGRLPEALAAYDLALVHDPQSASTHWNRALSLLQAGDFAQGWREYEWRWQRPQTPPRPFREPRWDGTPLQGRTLLIYMEQGLGDMLLFIRFARLAKERGGKVIVECPPMLVELFARCPGVDQVVAEGSPLPPFDVQVPLMSLSGLLGTTLETVPADVPYLFAEDALVQQWGMKLQERLGRSLVGQAARATDRTPTQSKDRAPAQRGDRAPANLSPTPDSCSLPSDSSPLTIGIVWQGNPRHGLDRYRSIPLIEFAPLARVPGVQLVSLQQQAGREQLHHLRGRFVVVELLEPECSWSDTAALVQNLDLVIAVDTAVCHLAGGLGKPVWVPLSAVGEWRWLLHRDDSPWYPTMRLFRQKRLGSWRGVFRRMVRVLTSLANAYGKEMRAKA
jgi:tetratricopeptide (TPR) repeat protein